MSAADKWKIALLLTTARSPAIDSLNIFTYTFLLLNEENLSIPRTLLQKLDVCCSWRLQQRGKAVEGNSDAFVTDQGQSEPRLCAYYLRTWGGRSKPAAWSPVAGQEVWCSWCPLQTSWGNTENVTSGPKEDIISQAEGTSASPGCAIVRSLRTLVTRWVWALLAGL